MLNLVQNYGIFTKLLFYSNYCQNKQKEQQKMLKRLRQKQIISQHNRREMTKDMSRQQLARVLEKQ